MVPEPTIPESTKKYITVYCSSSDAAPKSFFTVAKALGKLIVSHGYGLVYGGSNVGLMLALATAVIEAGGEVIGVMPKVIAAKGITNNALTKLISVEDMRERKETMERLGSAFIALPGGFGTLEEIIEVLTAKQLQLHSKPIVFLNWEGCWDFLLKQFEYFVEKKLAKAESLRYFQVSTTPENVLGYIDNYHPFQQEKKWF